MGMGRMLLIRMTEAAMPTATKVYPTSPLTSTTSPGTAINRPSSSSRIALKASRCSALTTSPGSSQPGGAELATMAIRRSAAWRRPQR